MDKQIVKIEVDVLNALLSKLASLPYAEVAQIIAKAHESVRTLIDAESKPEVKTIEAKK